jgi:hypothetical protein
MKSIAMKYGVFLAMVAFTALVVRPAAQKFNVPLLKDI